MLALAYYGRGGKGTLKGELGKKPQCDGRLGRPERARLARQIGM